MLSLKHVTATLVSMDVVGKHIGYFCRTQTLLKGNEGLLLGHVVDFDSSPSSCSSPCCQSLASPPSCASFFLLLAPGRGITIIHQGQQAVKHGYRYIIHLSSAPHFLRIHVITRTLRLLLLVFFLVTFFFLVFLVLFLLFLALILLLLLLLVISVLLFVLFDEFLTSWKNFNLCQSMIIIRVYEEEEEEEVLSLSSSSLCSVLSSSPSRS